MELAGFWLGSQQRSYSASSDPNGDPIIAQPVSMNFDERGRLWVMQYLQYPFPAGLKILSEDKFLRAVYDKVPPPPPNPDVV